jgi:hypothetical protein
MTRNMGTADRAIRGLAVTPFAVVLGVILGPTSVASIVLYAIAGVMALTAATGFCPLYLLRGCNTRKEHGGRETPVTQG